jgi:O-acetyl-ADP-ribose deacetylase (regulator of RNase III)
MPVVTLVLGDLTLEDVDAVVNAANPGLMGGGGVDGAIHRRGGPEILAECKEVRRTRYPDGLPTGEAVPTTGGKLRARWVIHTVGPRYHEHDDPAPLLARCHTEALRIADELGARTVAFPAISTGIYGYPVEEAAPVAVAAVLGAETRLEEIRFVLFDPRSYEAFRSALDAADRP